MIQATALRAVGNGPEAPIFRTATVVKWLIGLRLVAVSALFLGVIVVQTTTEELLPISPLIRITGLTYALSLVWLVLWLVHLPPGVHGALQIAGDLGILTTLIYLTGGPTSPFAFLFIAPIGLAALMFDLRGGLTTAGGAFVMYAGLALLIGYGVVPASPWGPPTPAGPRSVGFQVFVNGIAFGTSALLTSYLAFSLQQAERRLHGERTSVARLMALSADVLRSVDSGVVAADTEGRVVLANPAALRALQRARLAGDETLADLFPLASRTWDDLLSPPPREPMRFEDTVTSSGLPLGCTLAPLADSEGRPVGFVVHFRDLTEARERSTRERLRERMAAVGEMAAGIAHEIRNPLASISGSAQVLGGVPGLGDSERRLSRIIVEESRRLSGIVESFLGYARPPDPHPGPCDIAAVLEETLTLFRNSAEVTAAHTIETSIAGHLAPIVADERQLRQAFFNLARNAIQAMPQGGTMRVEAGPSGSRYIVRWQDDGIGMEPQQVEEIFQPFRAFRRGGTGLGLAVVYSIVADHGGEISVDSRPGEGTTFVVSLPLEPA